MRVFVTGASGWIGSAVVPELLHAGAEAMFVGGLVRIGRADEDQPEVGQALAQLGGDLHQLELPLARMQSADHPHHLARRPGL